MKARQTLMSLHKYDNDDKEDLLSALSSKGGAQSALQWLTIDMSGKNG